MLLNRARLLIVMEMMEGGELFHRISQHRHFTEKQASQVTKQASHPLSQQIHHALAKGGTIPGAGRVGKKDEFQDFLSCDPMIIACFVISDNAQALLGIKD